MSYGHWKEIDRNDVLKDNNEWLIQYKSYSFRRKKLNIYRKKENKHFDLYYCVCKGCRVSIRHETTMNRYYIQDSIKDHYHKPEDLSVSASVNPNKSRKVGDKRTINEIDDVSETKINGVLPSAGFVEGGYSVDIYFSVTFEDGMTRLLRNEPIIGSVWFGDKLVTECGKPWRKEDTTRLKSFKLHSDYKDCEESNFLIDVVVPRADVPGAVVVGMNIFGKVLVKENGYTYYSLEEPKEELGFSFQHHSETDVDSNDFTFDLASIGFGNGSGREYGEDDTDIFGGNVMIYSVAQNRLDLVKYLVEKKNWKLDRKDLFGFTPLDVAVYFKRIDIKKYILSKLYADVDKFEVVKELKKEYVKMEEEKKEMKDVVPKFVDTRPVVCSFLDGIEIYGKTGEYVGYSKVSDSMNREKEETRIDSIVDLFGDLRILLFDNKEIKLSKCLLINSGIRNVLQDVHEFSLVQLKINVNEKIILRLILEKEVKIPSNLLLDYYLLFSHLQMKKEMKYIVKRVLEITNFEECYESFKRVCQEDSYENEEVRKWFTQSDVNLREGEISSTTFSTSFTLALFNQLKEKYNPKILAKQDGGVVLLGLFALYEDIIDPMTHSDFVGVDFDALTVQKMFLKLQGEEMEKTKNVILESTDGKEFPAHKELLVYRFEYFKRMFEFHGIEREGKDDPNQKIGIIDMNNDVLSAFLDYVYTGKVECVEIEVLIQMIVLAEKYTAPVFLKCCVNRLDSIGGTEDVGFVKDVLRRIGHQLHENEVSNKFVVPFLVEHTKSVLSVRKIQKILRKSFNDFCLGRRLSLLERGISSLENENTDLKGKLIEHNRVNSEQNRIIGILQREIEGMRRNHDEVFRVVGEDFIVQKMRIEYLESLTSSSVYTWGFGGNGSLGHGTTKNELVPKLVEKLVPFKTKNVICGYNSCCSVILSNGDLLSFGYNRKRRLGHEKELHSILSPECLVQLPENRKIIQATHGYFISIFLDDCGDIWGCGDNSNGYLTGQKSNETFHHPVKIMIPGSPKIKKIVSGGYHFGCICASGKLYTWGGGGYGQLGHGNTSNVLQPQIVKYFENIRVKDVSMGGYHTLVLSEDGKIYSFGGGSYGKLGNGNTSNSSSPSLIKYFCDNNIVVTKISCGYNHSGCIDSVGNCYKWGYGVYGQIGNGSFTEINPTPIRITSFIDSSGKPIDLDIPNSHRFVQLESGSGHNIAVLEETKHVRKTFVLTWGRGNYGRLGLNNEENVNIPTVVPFFENKRIKSVHSGGSMSAVIL